MKIAYLVEAYGILSETFVRDLAIGLTHKDHQVSIICGTNHQTTSHENFEAIHEIDFKYKTMPLPIFILSEGWRSFFSIARHLLQCHVMHIHGYLQNLYFSNRRKHCTAQLLKHFKDHSYDAAFIEFGTAAFLASDALKSQNIPYIVHFHAWDVTKALKYKTYRDSLEQLCHDAHALIAPSAHIKRLLVLEGAQAEKIHVIHPIADLSNLAPLPWKERTQSTPSIITLGRLVPKKNTCALLHAFAHAQQESPEAKLSIVGDGPEKERITALIKKLGLSDAVTLHGALPHEEALALMNQHWIMAQHSVTSFEGDQEGFPVSLTEAAALELPIVSTAHSGIAEQVIPNKTGFLAAEFDYETMGEHFITLLKDPALCQKMGQEGRKHIMQISQEQNRIESISALLNNTTTMKRI